MNYRLFFEAPQKHFIRIEMDLPPSGEQPTEVRLSKWRPGRYELGPYVENIVQVEARSASGKALPVTKTAYNHWQVAASGNENAVLHYAYHAIAPDAGASFFDEHQVYVNGVNLFMYLPDQIATPCTVALNLPGNYKIACGMRQQGHTLHASDFHELVDCPFIASPTLQHRAFEVSGIQHNLWFQGETRPDFARIQHDFQRFGAAQTELFGEFPAKEYHYIFQIHNKHFYHGVEHQNSTVLAFGPGFRIMQPEFYQELLGLCCHELFHAWNVKAIRPADMRPYDYDSINYSRLHYVTEGVTTYYGDLMLLKSGVWPLEEYLEVLNDSVFKKHYANNGRDHVSLEASSFDSWINGYKPGVPNHKISFYTKGCLAAFILDYLIRRGSKNLHSLDSVMREMYVRFGKTGIGYTRADYQSIAEAHGGFPLDDYFRDFVAGTLPMEPMLAEAAAYFGLELLPRRPGTFAERDFGFMSEDLERSCQVKQIWEGSPAERAGLSIGDEIIAVNGLKVMSANIDGLLGHFQGDAAVRLHVFRSERLVELSLQRDAAYKLERYFIQPMMLPSPTQMENRLAWMRVG